MALVASSNVGCLLGSDLGYCSLRPNSLSERAAAADLIGKRIGKGSVSTVQGDATVRSNAMEVVMSRQSDGVTGQPHRTRTSAAGRAAILVGCFVVILWIVQIGDSAAGYPLLRFGIEPRSVGKLQDIVIAPFVHVSYHHLLGNTLPLVILGFLVALRGIRRFLLISGLIGIVSGLGVWLTAPSGSDTVGASSVIFGYFGFLLARGIIERRVSDLLVGAVVGLLYWSILSETLPGTRGISWQGHLFGLVGGVLAALVFRERQPSPRQSVDLSIDLRRGEPEAS